MREIKFRCYDTRNKEMLDADRLSISIKNGLLESIWFQKDVHCSFGSTGCYLDQKQFILMQFTGLKDKNGKEIYEGDITDLVGVKRVIEYKEGKFIGWHPQCEIIGNIYENPKLTKSKDVDSAV